VHRGEILGIAGVDGNGQAELAEAVMGLRPSNEGQITIASSSMITHPDPKPTRLTRPGYIPQDRRRAGLILRMGVRENLVLEIHAAPEFRRGLLLRRERLWAAARAMAARFDVRVGDERLPAASLSGGNQQKIVIVRALTGERALLVAVNPTRGLDVAATRYVHDQLRAARAAGVGILLISTELDEVLELSDRVGVLYNGQLQAIVPTTESRERIGRLMGGIGGTA
jgi:simple sugar transport system ATP-binding protein